MMPSEDAMLEKKAYANGQKVYELAEGRPTFFYKNGSMKAQGPYQGELMTGQWRFYREGGELWQVGRFLDGVKDGEWIRYGKDGLPEYRESFTDGR